MSDVHISKIDETYVRIQAERSILMELSERFSFMVPNAHFIPAVKNHLWDGKIRLLNLRTGAMYLGLHSLVKEYCDQNGYSCVYDDSLDVENPFSVDEFNRFIKALKLSTNTPEGRIAITPHDYQQRGIIHAIQAKRALLLSPTASGKSLMIYVLLRYYLARMPQGKILIIVPTANLVQQLYSDFEDYAALTNWEVEKFCHTIYDGAVKETDKRVVISTWQALAVKERLPIELRSELTKAEIRKWNKQAPYLLDDSYFAEFKVVFGDECHLFANEDRESGGELMAIMHKLVNAKYRVGTTGTLKDSKVNHLILEGIFGKVYKTISTKEMIDQKKAAKLHIKCVQLQYSDADRKAIHKKTYQEEMEFLLSHSSRNRFIRNLALSLKGNTLVLFERVEKHGHVLQQLIQDKLEDGRQLFYVHGATAVEDRNRIRGITEGENNAIILASYGTFSTGVNIRNIHNIIFASPTKAKIRVLQSIGRGLRLSSTKTEVTLFDLADDLSVWNKAGTSVHDNFSLQHLAERIQFYNAEEFEYMLYKIQFEDDQLV